MTESRTARARIVHVLHHPATAWVILFLSFVLTGVAWHLSDSFVRQRAQDRFMFQTQEVKDSIHRRMLDYEATLRGGVGLFAATPGVTRKSWHDYVESLQIVRYFPGIQGFGYSQVVSAVERARHEAGIRGEGFPDYQIKPAGARDPYTAIIFLEPFVARNLRAFGYDMFSEPTRRAAMERARDSGQPALSGRVTLVQETETDVQHGVLMYLPVFRPGALQETEAQRREALQGFVYAPFRMRDLMKGILSADQGDIEFELYDGGQPDAARVLHQSASGALRAMDTQGKPEFSSLSQIEIAGRIWTVYLYGRDDFLSKAEESQPLVVAVGGLLVDLLLFYIIASIARQQKRAEALAHEMTIDLQRSNVDLEQFAYAASHDMRQPLRMVSSYLQLLEIELKPVLTEDTRQNLQFAVDGAQRMDRMLTALLDYARIGHNAEGMQPFESRLLLGEALRYLEPDIVRTQASVQIEGQWPKIQANRDEMVRLFQNLVGNAIKYRVAGRAPVVIVEAIPGAHEHRFSVQDNGVGFKSGQEERLFKVFERLHAREQYPGTGIGLALCRKIVEHHDGQIWASSPGEQQGATFSFTLPADREVRA